MSIELAERPDDSERFLIAYSLLRGMAREEGMRIHSPEFMGWAKSFAARLGLPEPRVWGDLPVEALEKLAAMVTKRQFEKRNAP